MNKDLESYQHYTQNSDSTGSDDGFVKFLIDHSEIEAPEIDENLAFLAVKRKIEQPKSSFVWMKIAAGLALLATLTVSLFLYNNSPDLVTVASADTRLKVTFPDGSTGILNENSTVTYPEFFQDSREITLVEGEAYFEVEESNVPFSIAVGEVDITVLGTSFNVEHSNGNVRLDVNSGLVAFKSSQEQIHVAAGKGATFLAADKKILTENEVDPNALSWFNGKFVFDNIPLNEVLEELSTYYKVKFKLKNEKLANCKISATFDNQELSQVLETLDTLLNLEISRKGKSIQISGKGC